MKGRRKLESDRVSPLPAPKTGLDHPAGTGQGGAPHGGLVKGKRCPDWTVRVTRTV